MTTCQIINSEVAVIVVVKNQGTFEENSSVALNDATTQIDLEDNSLSTTSLVNEPQIGYIYVFSVEMNSFIRRAGKYTFK